MFKNFNQKLFGTNKLLATVSLLFVLVPYSCVASTKTAADKSQWISKLKPVCTEEFQAVDFYGDEITVTLNPNEPGPCDWHKEAPKFGNGNYDFFSENYLQVRTEYNISQPLEMRFGLQGLDSSKRFNFLELAGGAAESCKNLDKPIFRVGRWDNTFFLSSLKEDGGNGFVNFDITSELTPKTVTEFELKMSKIGKARLELTVYANEVLLFSAQAYTGDCTHLSMKFGARSFGKKHVKPQIAKFSFKGLVINGSVAESNYAHIDLNFPYLLNNDQLALCNDGTQAGFYSTHPIQPNIGRKILIAFEGGGAALSASSTQTKYQEAYDKRPAALMTSPLIKGKKKKSLTGYFKKAAEDGWVLIYLPYCSSDLYMGDHRLELNGEVFEVRGRRIVEALTTFLVERGVLTEQTDLLLVGGSAGDVAISSNLDLFERLPKSRLRLLFTMWQVPSERIYLEKKQASTFNKIVPNSHLKFSHGNPADHCRDSIAACTPNHANISRFQFDDFFIEGHWKELPGQHFAYTPKHMNNYEVFKNEMINAIQRAGGGFALLGEKVWKPKKNFNHTMGNLEVEIGDDPVIPANIVWNWISGQRPTRYIGK